MHRTLFISLNVENAMHRLHLLSYEVRSDAFQNATMAQNRACEAFEVASIQT